MSYKISVKEFLKQRKAGDIDAADFAAKFNKHAEDTDREFMFFHNTWPVKENDGALFGLPVSVKDNICVRGVESSAGSRILEGYRPTFDATSVARLRSSGAEFCGKTNQDEFGFGTFSTNSGYGVPRNPHDPKRSCGGSSGGAAGFTAACEMPHAALAESTGGSISCPASFCGVFGLTPTYGLVSRYGLIDYANSLDKIGLMAKSVHEIALLLSRIAGPDAKDSTSAGDRKEYTSYLGSDIKGTTIGIPKQYFDVDPKVKKSVNTAVSRLESAGAKTKKVSLPKTRYALAAYYIIATAEASTNLARFCGMRYGLHKELKGNFNQYFSRVRSSGFGKEAKRRIILGTFARMSGYRDQYYMKAMKVRTLVIQDFKRALKSVDILAAPTMPILPPRFDEIEKLSPIETYQMDALTVPANLAGIPTINVPCGFVGKLPVGMHLMADHFNEGALLRAAHVYENL